MAMVYQFVSPALFSPEMSLDFEGADNSNFAASVGSSTGAERGVGPASFHFRITLAAATGVFKARWEERP